MCSRSDVLRTICLLVSLLAVGCSGQPRPAPGGDLPPTGQVVELPEPDRTGSVALEETLADRRSIREYTLGPLDDTTISQLLWAAQGVTSDQGARTAPSAGGTYPLELYIVREDGWYRYVPSEHHLIQIGSTDQRTALSAAALDQEAVADAPAVFVITAVYARTEQIYGDRAERYVQLEAGHAAQNLLLQAVAEGLAAVPIGAFRDGEVTSVLALPDDHEPLYLVPVGHPNRESA